MEQIGERILDHGWKSYISYGRKRMITPSKSHAIRIGNYFSVRVHGGISLFDCHGLGSEWETKRFVKRIQELSPDLIHLHNIHGYYLNYRVLFEYLARTDIPVVWTLHDCWSFTGHCSYFAFAECDKYKNRCDYCPQIGSYPRALFWDNSRNNFLLKKELFTSLGSKLTLVPVSQWLASAVRESFFSDTAIQVIYNGVDTGVFYPHDAEDIRRKYCIEDKKVILGVASPWSPRKGYDDFVELRSHLPDNYVIVLIGLSQKQIKKLPHGMIGITRLQNQHLLADFYATADIVMSLSREETFGMTIAEGFACGIPAIVYNCTATPELVTPSTGLIVEPGDIRQLVNAVEKIISDGKDYYKNACLKRAYDHFDKHLCFQTYIDLYRKLLHED
nr:glycosyltransferase [Alistipes sp. D31t1_170403_E11]